MLIKHKQRWKQEEITTIITSTKHFINWKKHFHKNSLYFMIHAKFEAENESDISSLGIKTTNIFKEI